MNMNAPFDHRMDNAVFLRWVQGREGRFELEKGRVVQQMTGGSRHHAILIGRFSFELSSRLDRTLWNVCPADLAVEIADTIRYPDVLVERAGEDGAALSSAAPVVLVEVLSPSSMVRDLRTKFAEYTGLPSLHAYIVASQDEPLVWHWQRDATGHFSSDGAEVAGRAADLVIDHLGVTIPLAEVYRGIGRG